MSLRSRPLRQFGFVLDPSALMQAARRASRPLRLFSLIAPKDSSVDLDITRGLAERFHQQLRIVRDDPIHPHCGGLQHFARIIDGPGNYGFSSGVQLIHQFFS